MYKAAADIVSRGETFIITAGAGMGVDSGLPDFRGDRGFWQAYPPYARLGMSFADCADPRHFDRDPAFGWGFYGHRTNLYRSTIPHEGFSLIRSWIERCRADYFVVTSNVDGQFQKAGFAEERIVEVHGSIHWLQCTTPCSHDIWENDEIFTINEQTMRSREVPRCGHCGEVSRPNILMFGDWSWLADRTRLQGQRFDAFLASHAERRIVVIEMGAGSAIPTIRATSERIGYEIPGAAVIRINPREPDIKAPHISLPCGALDGLKRIDSLLGD